MNSRICKRIMSVILAVCMIMTNAYFPFGFETYALENIAAETDFSEAKEWNITDDTIKKLPTGETLIYSTITIASGKTLTIKGGGTLVADKISGGKIEIISGTVSANSVSSQVNLINGSLCTAASTGPVTVAGGAFQSDSLKSTLNISGGTVNIGTFASTSHPITITGGITEINSVECSELNFGGTGSLNCTSIKAYKMIIIASGTVIADSIEGRYICIYGGKIESKTISGIKGSPIIITGGDIKTDTLKGGDGINSTLSYTINDVTYYEAAGGEIDISGGTVEINQELIAGNSYKNYDSGDINITGGKVTITGNVTAGSAPQVESAGSCLAGGDIQFSENADIIVNGNITAGNGSDFDGYYGNGGAGGNVYIYRGIINGNITSGKGGYTETSISSSTKYKGGNGGAILIDGGEIYGNLISGRGGYGYGNNTYGTGGDITINAGTIKIKSGFTLGSGGWLKTSTDGTAVITTSNLPPMNYFTSGVIKISGDIRVYGKQTFTSDEYLDEYDTLTVKTGAELTVSGSELKVNGELQNNGSIIINADADLTGTGTYIYNNEEISIPELKEKLIGEMITMPESIVYDGEDHKGSVSIESKEAYGIKFMGMDLSKYAVSLSYSRTADGEKHSTETAKNAGYYTVLLKNSSDELIASKDFEITRKELSVSSVIATEGDGEITGINFSGLVDGEVLEFGTDYTVNNAVIEGEAATGVITLLDTPAAQNYTIKDNGSFSCDSIEYAHVHNMTWKYDDEYHWKECSCGEKTDKEAHIKGEGVVVKEATDNSDGEITYSCTECGYVMERKVIHKFSEEWKSDETGHWKECSCGERDTVYPHGNDEGYTGIVTEEATPEKDGVRTFYCKECGYAYRTEAVKYEHVHAAYGDWLSDKTYHWHICKCGAEDAIFDKAEHTSDQGTVIKSATETEEGLIRYCCTVCGAMIREVTIPVISGNEGKCGDDLFWAYDNGTLTISGTGTMYDYAFESKAPWYKYNTQITKIIVQNGAESIGNVAFYNLTALMEISLPNSLKSIGKNAFSNCKVLTEISVPDNVSTIGSAAFSSCIKLENVTLPKNLKSISSSLFSKCYALKNLEIPEKVTSVETMSFYYCTGLTSVTIPDSVTKIGISAFCNCENLSSVVLGKQLQTIEASAFAYCYKMKDTEIPDTVTFIGNSAFYDCYAITTVTIPDGVEEIYGCTFENCKALEAVAIPASVTLIEEDAFTGCSKLTHIHIPYAKTASDYSGQGGLPANSEYYFTLDESGTCPDKDCPIHSHSAAEIIIGVEIGEDKVLVKYGYETGSSVSRTVSFSFDQVNTEIVDYMADTDIQLVSDFVNAFTAVDNDCIELTTAQMKAVEYVLSCDYGYSDTKSE